MTPTLFSQFGLSPELQKAIHKLGFEQASPIQAEAIPLLLQGRDVVGQSHTGSGKTAAFGIPAVEKADPAVRAVQVLILCPTRELAVQVAEEIHKLALFKRGLHTIPIYGGQSYERQFHGLQQGAQIVIGTPGRIMDHLRRGTLRLDAVRLAVLDEADVMLNMGFREDIETILQGVPETRQTVFFSATIPTPIRELIDKYARDPQNVRIEQRALTVPTVEQEYYEIDRHFKMELLTRLIDIHDFQRGIIFCNTKRMVDDLAEHLEGQGYVADCLHGDMTQNLRDRVMNRFRNAGLEFLVATDVAARGIDVDDVQVVFNYDLPYDFEDYVHRIGRTGRAGRSGRAISFVSGREFFQIRHLERFLKTRIQRARVPTVAEVEEARDVAFLSRVRDALVRGDGRCYTVLVEQLVEEGFNPVDVAATCLAQLQGDESPANRKPAVTKPAVAKPAPKPANFPPPISPAAPAPVVTHPVPPVKAKRAKAAPPAVESVAPEPVAPTASVVPPPPPTPVVDAEPVSAQPFVPSAPEPESVPEPAMSAPPVVVPVSVPAPEPEPEPALVEAVEPVIAAAPEPVAEVKPAAVVEPVEPVSPVPAAAGPEEPVTAPAAPVTPPATPVKTSKVVIPPAAATRPKPLSERRLTPKPVRPPMAHPAERPSGRSYERPYDRRPPGPREHLERPERPFPGPRDRRERPEPREQHRPPWFRPASERPMVAKPIRAPRAGEGPYTRLHLNVGAEMGVGPGDIVGAIAGETGLPASIVGRVDIRERHLFVEVAEAHANVVRSRLSRTTIRGHHVKAKVA